MKGREEGRKGMKGAVGRWKEGRKPLEEGRKERRKEEERSHWRREEAIEVHVRYAALRNKSADNITLVFGVNYLAMEELMADN
jgi:hypothetical protein